MIFIKDNFFTEDIRKLIADQYLFSSMDSRIRWFNCTIHGINNSPIPAEKLLFFASIIFNLKNMVGFECWFHKNTRVDWHYDKDDILYNTEKKLFFPLCSIVYYPYIDNLQGGEFLTDTIEIKPIPNRAIFFAPGIYHKVKEFKGQRISLSINPWCYKPKQYS